MLRWKQAKEPTHTASFQQLLQSAIDGQLADSSFCEGLPQLPVASQLRPDLVQQLLTTQLVQGRKIWPGIADSSSSSDKSSKGRKGKQQDHATALYGRLGVMELGDMLLLAADAPSTHSCANMQLLCSLPAAQLLQAGAIAYAACRLVARQAPLVVRAHTYDSADRVVKSVQDAVAHVLKLPGAKTMSASQATDVPAAAANAGQVGMFATVSSSLPQADAQCPSLSMSQLLLMLYNSVVQDVERDGTTQTALLRGTAAAHDLAPGMVEQLLHRGFAAFGGRVPYYSKCVAECPLLESHLPKALQPLLKLPAAGQLLSDALTRVLKSCVLAGGCGLSSLLGAPQAAKLPVQLLEESLKFAFAATYPAPVNTTGTTHPVTKRYKKTTDGRNAGGLR